MRHENTRGTKYWRIEKQNEKKQGRREEEQWRFSPTNYPAPPPQYLKLRQLISAILERGGPAPWRRGGKLRRRCIFSQNLANSRTHGRIHERQGLLSAGTLNQAGKRGGGAGRGRIYGKFAYGKLLGEGRSSFAWDPGSCRLILLMRYNPRWNCLRQMGVFPFVKRSHFLKSI